MDAGIKYKPCCAKRCLLGNCETRDSGGCYCVCSLKDLESSLISQLSGNSFRKGDAIIYIPGHLTEVSEEEKNKIQQELQLVRDKLRKYIFS